MNAPGPTGPLRPGRPATRTVDCVRHGITTSFAALNALEATVIGRCMQRQCHQKFLRFLNDVEATVPAGEVVHVLLGDCRMHTNANVQGWLSRHSR